jgi:hypothetical protein
VSVAEAAAIGAGLALASRALALVVHRRWFRQGFAGDSSAHLAIVRTLRRRPTARWIDEYVIAPEPMSYPTGFHRIASLLPLTVLEAHSWLPNLLLWIGGIGAFAGYSAFAARSLLHIDPTSTVWLALAFVLTTPSSVVFRGPAIAYLKLSERLLGRLSTAFAVLLLVVGTIAHDEASLIAATIAVAVAFTSSIFARQALVFGLPLLALVSWAWQPLAVLAAGTALALAIGRRRFVHGVRHTWIQWHLYSKLTKASSHVGSELSHFARLSGIRRALRDRNELMKLLGDREPIRALIMYPEIVVAGTLLGFERQDFAWRWSAPLVVFVAVYLVTATQRFNHLGEAYRYLEYGLFLLVPFELALLVQSWSLVERLILVVAFAVWSATLAMRAIVRGTWLASLPDRDVLSEFLRKVDLRPGDVVFPVSMHVAIDICARVDGVRSFWWQPGIISTGIYDEFIEEYPYLKREYQPLFERYAVTHVVCDKADLERLDWAYDFSDLVPLSEDERYVAFAVPQPAAGLTAAIDSEAVR